MPPKSINKAASKASKGKTTPPKAKKAKTTPKKQPSKGKAPPKTTMPSPEPEETNPTPPHSPFVYSPSDPQEKLFNFNCHSDPISEPEDEEEQEPDPGAPEDEPIELWDLNSIHNVCNRNGTFAVPATYPVSYPIMTKKGGAGFVHKGYSFICNNKKKPIRQHHFKCDNVGCPARLTTFWFTHFKVLTIGHDCVKPFDPLYQLICWFLCQVIPTTKDQTANEVVNNALINLNDTQLVTVSSIMPGIVCPSKKAQKAGKPVSKLTKLTDLNQTVDQKWVLAAPVCHLKPAPPCKLMLINQCNMRVTQYKLIN
ncbi:hypothetical protein DSO57_1035339 [Entomophthora muscae]|uniref:Uncharacterized protein n=1 Tax=Entomophthora muscae TaxID=34485 RepID=A0ACC2UK44_9FUNG|nr:hypothetical protein DSO57_1035339 [Entomophthora muscae]